MRSAQVPTRILACEPYRAAVGSEADPLVGLVIFRGNGATYVRSDLVLPPDEVFAAVKAECESAVLVADAVDSDRRSILVCTQGSHDICCGEMGTALADVIVDDEAGGLDVDVFRVSHTGGHRFAPTALSMPDGRMWAYLTFDDVRSIMDRTGSPANVQQKCRGWIGAKGGAGQAAERAVFATADWEWDTKLRSVEIVETSEKAVGEDSTSWKTTVIAGQESWDIDVAVGRQVPSIACSQPGGRPAKPGREYIVISEPQDE